MLPQKKTHKEVKSPKITSRYLADYMAASEQKRRTIIRSCKYPPIARLLQHTEAKAIISNFIKGVNPDPESLKAKAKQLKERLADNDFDRQLYDVNADFLERFALKYILMNFPGAEILASGNWSSVSMGGVDIKPEVNFKLQRVDKTNKVRLGLGGIRYAKGVDLPEEVANWQTAFAFGYLGLLNLDGEAPETKLCLVVDAHSGKVHSAPTNSVSRFNNMEAACHTIAERWDNIEPPEGAVI